MKYKLSYMQDGGTRPYDMCEVSLQDTLARPLSPLEALGYVVQDVVPFIAANVQRISGYSYICGMIKEGSIGAEIGVDFGDGAYRLLKRNPARLYLVDPWKATIDKDSWTDVSTAEMNDRYIRVVRNFAEDPRVSIRRQTSSDFFKCITDDGLDWVYIDGDHHMEQVLSDLVDSLRCVKSGGFIAGDDLHNSRWGKDVRAALHAFIASNGKHVDILWDESDPFVLRVK